MQREKVKLIGLGRLHFKNETQRHRESMTNGTNNCRNIARTAKKVLEENERAMKARSKSSHDTAQESIDSTEIA